VRVRSIAVASALLGLALVGCAAARTPAPPTLRVVSTSPLVVAGTGFRAGERVTVTALSSVRPHIVRIRATRRGSFRVRLGRFTQPCGSPWAVRARGASRRVAVVRLAAAPCVPPPIR
jgi:hypothetical protein